MTEPFQMFEPDIVRFVQRKFGVDAGVVMEKLVRFCRESPDLSSPRLLRCIVYAAEHVAGIDLYIQMTRLDYRDTIVAGECRQSPGKKRREGTYYHVRDLNLPFPDDLEVGTETKNRKEI